MGKRVNVSETLDTVKAEAGAEGTSPDSAPKLDDETELNYLAGIGKPFADAVEMIRKGKDAESNLIADLKQMRKVRKAIFRKIRKAARTIVEL